MAASPGFQEPNSCPYCRATPKQLYHMLVPWCEEIKKAAEENMRRWAPNIDDDGNYVILVCKPCEVEYQRRDDVRMRHASIISGRQMIGPTWVDRAWAQWWDDAWTDFCIRECVQISTLRDIWKAHVFFGYWVRGIVDFSFDEPIAPDDFEWIDTGPDAEDVHKVTMWFP